ncbi:MAG: DUF2130 domain-containing protein [Planctomycetaceae bacterium]|nr:DUF2130 domain-containing protein [Planctomycetaceae bacterium]
METTKINCPNCGHEFNAEEVLLRRIEEKNKQKLSGKIAELEKSFQEKENAVKQREREIEKLSLEIKKQSEDLERQSQEKAKAIVAETTPALKTQIKAQVAEEYETRLKSLAEADAESKKKITELKNTQIENERLKRQIDAQKQDMELEFERKLSKRLEEEANTIRQREKESSELVIQEFKKQLDDQKKLVDEMKRKAEQGSTQMQGEVQEIALEKLLRELYEIEGDEIEEVKKGQRGADVIHVVKTRQGDLCGKICYESKRTKKFDEGWLQKLRDDNLEVNADVLVIVTETMPVGQDRFFCKDNVWICPFGGIKEFSMVMRYAIMQVHEASVVTQGVETKMELIYQFLTSNEFKGQFTAIFEGFEALRQNMAKQRMQMEKNWKEQEKQLEKITVNAVRFYGSIKGIAGKSIPNIKMLEDETQPLLEG